MYYIILIMYYIILIMYYIILIVYYIILIMYYIILLYYVLIVRGNRRIVMILDMASLCVFLRERRKTHCFLMS